MPTVRSVFTRMGPILPSVALRSSLSPSADRQPTLWHSSGGGLRGTRHHDAQGETDVRHLATHGHALLLRSSRPLLADYAPTSSMTSICSGFSFMSSQGSGLPLPLLPQVNRRGVNSSWHPCSRSRRWFTSSSPNAPRCRSRVAHRKLPSAHARPANIPACARRRCTTLGATEWCGCASAAGTPTLTFRKPIELPSVILAPPLCPSPLLQNMMSSFFMV
mmetsp:Transcript_88807/g.240183  ORF Transcript_88807/g.240183 Transcript_88807/m.240183 type:complete len:219 (-) Transcript_88807:787-1443(-)